ncbi:MAG: hypothetical protein HKN00_01550 [Flavobacteriaceae bacterium]|nr:hypothetical protein [Bacteroidia bacterium]MBT8269491.1 hypothetical protein [Bacteroidia bacterium]MBT8286919.1 hypothetical protein [Bacteroidia bacterium]NNF73841.1 hypothetical protein [Flavobacteriaceae bacterium]NNK72883.1 hypothetical protein [Flavobacteriaceae bacterium]
MSMDSLTEFFKDHKGKFDLEEPRSGHEKRFLEKLNQTDQDAGGGSTTSEVWKPFLMIAASLTLIMMLVIGSGNTNSRDLASISPEMATTQDFFTTTISTELAKLNSEDSPEFQDLVVDALFQIKILEEDYQKLKKDLTSSGDDKRVIHAMIENFQNRIDILQQVSEQIDELKQLKETNNENSFTL